MSQSTSFNPYSRLPDPSPYVLARVFTDNSIYKLLSSPFKGIGNLFSRMWDSMRKENLSTVHPINTEEPGPAVAPVIRSILKAAKAPSEGSSNAGPSSDASVRKVNFNPSFDTERKISRIGSKRPYPRARTKRFIYYTNAKTGQGLVSGRRIKPEFLHGKPKQDPGVPSLSEKTISSQ